MCKYLALAPGSKNPSSKEKMWFKAYLPLGGCGICLELLMGEGYSDNKSYLGKSHFLPSLASPVHPSFM